MAGFFASPFFFSLIALWTASKAAISVSCFFHFLDIYGFVSLAFVFGREQSYLGYSDCIPRLLSQKL